MKKRIRIVCLCLTALLALSGCATPTQPQTEQTTLPSQLAGDLICVEISRFSGGFVEDGTGTKVTDVAAILVDNQTGKFVDLATVTYTVGEKTATFQITGLPAGERVWVLEKNRLSIAEGDELVFEDCQIAYKADAIQTTQLLSVARQGNSLTVENKSGRNLKNVCVYYKNRMEDGTFLGGITYVINFGDLAAGATAQRTAGHFGDESSIVRYSYQAE